MAVSRGINGHRGRLTAARRREAPAGGVSKGRLGREFRHPSSGRDRWVTVLTSDTRSYGQGALLVGIEQAARGAGFQVHVGLLAPPRAGAVSGAVDQFCGAGCEGVIVIVPSGVSVVAAPTAADVREGRECTGVALEERAAARLATRHLLDLGHRTVHHVSVRSPVGAGAREQGWRQALLEAGADAPEPAPGEGTPESGYEAGRHLAADPGVTAVVCGTDDMAVGVLHALREAGRSVPDDVSVVGIDDLPGAEFCLPALTTVRLNFLRLGHDCFAVLQELLVPEKRPAAAAAAAAPQLIVRATTRNAPAR